MHLELVRCDSFMNSPSWGSLRKCLVGFLPSVRAALETTKNKGHLPLLREGAFQVPSVVYLHWGCIWEVILMPCATSPFSPSELWVCPLLQQIAILPVEAATRVGHAHGHSLCEGQHFLFPLWLMSRWADMLLPWRYHIYSPSTFPLPTAVLPKLERACIRKAC